MFQRRMTSSVPKTFFRRPELVFQLENGIHMNFSGLRNIFLMVLTAHERTVRYKICPTRWKAALTVSHNNNDPVTNLIYCLVAVHLSVPVECLFLSCGAEWA